MSGSGLWAGIRSGSESIVGPKSHSTHFHEHVTRLPASFLDMAPVLKVHEQDTAIMEKRKGKRKVDDLNEDGEGDNVPNIKSPNKKKRNKQRVLLLSSRGITHRMRHLMNDLETLLPHVKKGVCENDPLSLVRVGFC
jgi:hypothetical protein